MAVFNVRIPGTVRSNVVWSDRLMMGRCVMLWKIIRFVCTVRYRTIVQTFFHVIEKFLCCIFSRNQFHCIFMRVGIGTGMRAIFLHDRATFSIVRRKFLLIGAIHAKIQKIKQNPKINFAWSKKFLFCIILKKIITFIYLNRQTTVLVSRYGFAAFWYRVLRLDHFGIALPVWELYTVLVLLNGFVGFCKYFC